ncbi:MAG: tetratricopeptide repeat protein [Myxococcota bacterium]
MTDDRPSAAHDALLQAHRDAPSSHTRAALVAAMAVEADRAADLADAGQPDAARRAWGRALRLGEGAYPDGHSTLAPIHSELAEAMEIAGNLDAAVEQYRRAIAREGEMTKPARAGRARARLAVLLHRRGQLDQAEPLYRQALTILTPLTDDRSAGLAVLMNSLATLLWQKDRLREAVTLAERSFAIVEANHAPSDEVRLTQQLDLAHMLERSGRPRDAVPLYRDALAHRTQALGPDHPDLGPVWLGLAHALNRADRPTEAVEAYQQAWTLLRARHTPPHPTLTGALLGLAHVLCRDERVDEAVERLEAELKELEFTLGADHPEVQDTVDHLAQLLEESGRYEQADAWVRASMEHRPPRPEDALTRGRLLERMGRLTEAETSFRRALDAQPSGPIATTAWIGLASVWLGLGRTAEAEQAARRGLAQVDDAEGAKALPALNNLAMVLRYTGRYDEAERRYRRALGLAMRHLGPEHPHTALVTNNLAMTVLAAGKLEEAASLSGHALALAEHTLGRDHPLTVVRRSNRGVVLRQLGRFAEAEASFREAEARLRAIRPEAHPDLGTLANNLGEVLAASGRHAEAERYFMRAVQTHATAYGSDHPLVGADWLNLARLRVRRRRLPEAHVALDRALAIEELDLRRNLLYGSPADRRARLAQIATSTDDAVTLHLRWRSNSESSALLALRTVLRRKGRAIEVEQDTLATIREAPPSSASVKALQTLRDLRSALSRLVTQAPSDPAAFEAWRAAQVNLEVRIAEQERALSEFVPELRHGLDPVSVSDVAKALGPKRALLEIVVYRPHDFDTDQFAAPRVAAYLLTLNDGAGEGGILARDLGPRQALDAAVSALRATIQDREEVTARARTLYRMLIEPFAIGLQGRKQLVVSCDGMVGLAPLDVVLEAGGSTLPVTYVTSGRDLLREREFSELGPPVVVYDVDYGPRGPWRPLPGAASEGALVRRVFSAARSLTGSAATETAVKALARPKLLHIATHGYVERRDEDEPLEGPKGVPRLRGLGVEALPDTPPHPSLRAGLILAGANRPPRGNDDGRLTAAEVASLDLRGTSLVVLSACETGVATPADGEGIAGLRRALVVAGAQAQLLSLWPVDDGATALLMAALYARLRLGLSVGDALAEAKSELRKDPRFAHPYLWAAFTLSGDPDVTLG